MVSEAVSADAMAKNLPQIRWTSVAVIDGVVMAAMAAVSANGI